MQKFFRGQRVRVADQMPVQMRHFPAGFEAIIDHSYSDAHGGGPRGDHQYSLLQLEHGKPINRISWYDESQLELVSDDRHAGERLLQLYKTSV